MVVLPVPKKYSGRRQYQPTSDTVKERFIKVVGKYRDLTTFLTSLHIHPCPYIVMSQVPWIMILETTDYPSTVCLCPPFFLSPLNSVSKTTSTPLPVYTRVLTP